MELSRISELLSPYLAEPLPDPQLRSISIYIDMLLRWNQKINLTAVRAPEEIVARHFGESLFAAQQLLPISSLTAAATNQPQSGIRVVDVGSGAGFPGVPMNIWAANSHLILIESNHKKAAFLREVVRSLGLKDVEVFQHRAEEYPPASAEIVTLRAVERFESVLPVAASLVAPAGRLALLIGARQTDTAKALQPRFVLDGVRRIPKSESRVLLIARQSESSNQQGSG